MYDLSNVCLLDFYEILTCLHIVPHLQFHFPMIVDCNHFVRIYSVHRHHRNHMCPIARNRRADRPIEIGPYFANVSTHTNPNRWWWKHGSMITLGTATFGSRPTVSRLMTANEVHVHIRKMRIYLNNKTIWEIIIIQTTTIRMHRVDNRIGE